eukprot:7570253-Pyramimonas_sp.AAC.1
MSTDVALCPPRRSPARQSPSAKKENSPTGNVIQDIHSCVRLLHCFGHFWRLYLRIGLIQYGTQFDPTPWAYGGIHPRRRESLMLLAKLLIWKMRSARMSFLAE